MEFEYVELGAVIDNVPVEPGAWLIPSAVI